MSGYVITYVARVRDDGSIRIHRHDQPDPVATITLPTDETSLRQALQEAGWRPTRRHTRNGDWRSISVERRRIS
ncbi:MAG: hypothetical protein ACRDPQ_12160 [Nocardioidaceae bacterium]